MLVRLLPAGLQARGVGSARESNCYFDGCRTCAQCCHIVVPCLTGLWLDKTARYKPQAAFGILASIAGNVMYGLTLVVGSWVMMLSGRLVAGIGAALLGVGESLVMYK